MGSGRLPVLQFRGRDGMIDFGWGHPRPSALPVQAWAEASTRALRAYGPVALGYGYGAGPGPLVEWLCDRLGHTDARAPRPSEVFVTAGVSQALELVTTVLVRPGETVLVDAPTYHLALRVFADHTTAVVPAPVDSDGIDPAATLTLIEELRDRGHRVPVLYLVPTFNNPTGACLPVERRRELVSVARRTGTVIAEDDTYRELAYDGPAPPSISALAGGEGVIRMGSFSKTVAPGVRVGWLTAPATFVARLVARGFVDSGGGIAHAAALTMAEFVGSGAFERNLDAVRLLYRGQRDHLVAAVRRHLPDVGFTPPGGGWFLWLRLPPGLDAAGLLPYAEAHGVSYLPGARFFAGHGGAEYLRLAYSMLDPEQLDEGTRRLAAALDDALSTRI